MSVCHSSGCRLCANAIFDTFAALKKDGNVVTWGHPLRGGDSSLVQGELGYVLHIFASKVAFAAYRADREIVTWTREGYKRQILTDGRGVTYVSPAR